MYTLHKTKNREKKKNPGLFRRITTTFKYMWNLEFCDKENQIFNVKDKEAEEQYLGKEKLRARKTI